MIRRIPRRTQVSSVGPLQFSKKLSVDFLSPSHLSHGVPIAASSILSTYEASDPKLYTFHRFYQGSFQVALRFCRHLAALELQISDQFSEDFFDDLVRSSQGQVVHVEYQ